MSRGTKKPKDINAPKKNQSSYFIFSNERRADLQKETGQSVTQISKIITGEWKEMDNERKKKYEQLAAEQKKRYAEEWEAYQKTDNYSKYQQQVAQWEAKERAMGRTPGQKTKGGKKQTQKPKQPESMPKRPQSSHFIFSNQRRNQMKEQYPDMRVTELSKLIANEWKLKSAEEKKVYEDKAKELKEKYNEEMKSYKETDEYSQYMEECARFKKAQKEADNMDEDEGEQIKVLLPRKPKDDHCPKKPLSSYFLYAQSVREQTKNENPNQAITEIAKEISKKWKTLSEEEKKPYIEEAARLKEEYNKKMADYKGSPEQLAYQQKLNEWAAECDKRKQKAKEKVMKKEAEKKNKGKKKPTPQKGKRRKTSRSMDEDEDESNSEGSSSESESDSDSDSESSSGSSSSGSSSSGSESSSDSD